MTMSDLRFDGKVAIITGAGGQHNLGRAYAMLLGARGAKVVVNDINEAGAERVAKEIVAAGGEAIADAHDISTSANAQAIVERAVDTWGRIDILVNNGGAMIFADFDEMTDGDMEKMIDSHLMGALWMARAVWPHFKAQHSGRIVMALSTAVGTQRVMYATAKGGMLTLNYALAMAGAPHGIACNGVEPLAWTDAAARTTGDGPMAEMMKALKPELVAPVVAYLAHEDCEVTGEKIRAMGGRANRYEYGLMREGDDPIAAMMSGGYTNPELTIEDLRDHWDEVLGADYRPLVFMDEAAMGGTPVQYEPTS
jgi:NAD(P)-dependent dehydrogenase (short-subunit alcohol dehydrogenase family)